MKTKYLLVGNILIDTMAVLYFIYTYFIQKVIQLENGSRLTNYQFWGLGQKKILFHYAGLPFIIIVSSLAITFVMILVNRLKIRN
ncbi:MAG: hypothetical protein K0S47_3587 [Herbinix sp.]|jgi:hypothetical protein|nr:hypothetical protein [Herbinix sp.]